MQRIAIIPARSRSKGLPNKNVLFLEGKPMLRHTVEAAVSSGIFQKIFFTTDSVEYADIISDLPVDIIIRDDSISSDNASSFVVIEDVLKRLNLDEIDSFMLLQPTSPLRNSNHIVEAYEQFELKKNEFDFLVSVVESDKSSILIKKLGEDNSLKYFDIDYSNYKRQSQKEIRPNGAIYIAKPFSYLENKHFYGKKAQAFLMDKISSVDVDTRIDFEYVYFLLNQRKKEEVLEGAIKNRILIKKEEFSKASDVTLIGHSQFDQWNLSKLNNHNVQNLGISGINSKQYVNLILKKDIIKSIGNSIFILLGTNDVVYKNWTIDSTINSLKVIVEYIQGMRERNPKVYLLETIHTAFRVDRNNLIIDSLNDKLREFCDCEELKYVELNKYFDDEFGKLSLKFTNDGLHLNDCGYSLLESCLERVICDE